MYDNLTAQEQARVAALNSAIIYGSPAMDPQGLLNMAVKFEKYITEGYTPTRQQEM